MKYMNVPRGTVSKQRKTRFNMKNECFNIKMNEIYFKKTKVNTKSEQ